MSRKPSNGPARLVTFATVAVTVAGILLVGFAVAGGRGTGAHGIICAILDEDGAGRGC